MNNLKAIVPALLVTGLLLSPPALAERPFKEGHGNQGGHDQSHDHEKHDRQGGNNGHDGDGQHRERHETSVSVHFGDSHRAIVREYYGEQFRSGHCPPGLKKKHNGCMPPGQAKKWKIGRPLPRDVIFYDLPPKVVVELGSPPSGHRYVRIAADILLIAIGTGMVIDAIEDIGNM